MAEQTNFNTELALTSAAPGALLRCASGELFTVAGVLYNDLSQTWFISYESSLGGPLRVQPLEALDGAQGGAWLTVVPQPSRDSFRDFLELTAPELAGIEDVILSHYRQTHRHQFGEKYLYGLFDAAKISSFSLSLEEGVALVAYRLVWVPGCNPQQLLSSGLALLKVLCSGLAPRINWSKVEALFAQEGPCALTDTLRSTLAADALQFCVQEELAWLDSRALFANGDNKDSKEAYDTARLGELLTLAQEGPLFTAGLVAWERKARVNIEGLRQAWMKKYASS